MLIIEKHTLSIKQNILETLNSANQVLNKLTICHILV